MRKRVRQVPWPCFLFALSAALTLGACGAAGQANAGTGNGTSTTPSSTASPTPMPTSTPSSAPPTLDLQTLTKIAEYGVATEGGRGVTQAGAVLTTRLKANAAASGAIINSDESVYLIQLKGHFTAYGASLPQTATGYPTGTYLTLIAEASNGRVVDWGVGNKAADLSSLGTVIALPL
jgi:hypothetical protein